MQKLLLAAGVDVSKDTLDIHYNDVAGKEHHLKVGNNHQGHAALFAKLGAQRTYLMEASGPYYLRLAFTLKELGADVRVENPVVIKRFIQMNLERNKNDRKDARWLYRYAVERDSKLWEMPAEEQLQCAQLISVINGYTHKLTHNANQLHALQQSPVTSTAAIKSLQKEQQFIERELRKMEEELQNILEQWQGEQLKNISSIPGLGKKAVARLIVCTNGFKKVSNHRQLIALAGLAPKEHSSGTSVRGRSHICKMGNGHLRTVLYMCAMSAIRHNKACKELFERMKAKGKPGKVALTAVCNKLLKQAFAVATKGTTYQADFCSRLC